ncbi:MAG TPA: hypothetical protein VIT67_02210 [Povalibacter sp.]
MSVTLLLTRRPAHAVAIATAFALVSCGGSGGSTAPSSAVASRPVAESDLEIAQALYAGTARTPVGFVADATVVSDQFVSTVQLKNTDIDPTLVASQPQHELCTDDWNQALDWSQTHAMQAPVYAQLVETNDHAHYFEFGRVRSGDPQFYLRERVFKCAYVDRTNVDLRSVAGSAGQLNQRPLTAEDLHSLTEYLWQFTRYNNFGHVVLKSSGTSTAAVLTHTLMIATLTRGGVSVTCDRIDVIAWRHTADIATGAMQLDVNTVLTFGARESGGVTQLCSG